MSYFNSTSLKDEYGFEAENTPMNEIRVAESYRLVGTTFIGTTKDTNFWTQTTSGNAGISGSVVQGSGEITLYTSTGISGLATYQSVRSARYIGSNSNRFRATIQLADTGVANSSKKWGAFDGTDGCYYELDGTSLYAVSLKNSVPTRVASTGWSHETDFPTLTNANTYEIYWTNSNIYYTIGGELKHQASYPTTTWSSTTTLPLRLSVANTGALQSNESLKCRVATICRLGSAKSETIYKQISSATTTVLKYGAGTLSKIVVNNPTNNTITVYDNTSAVAGSQIAIITPGNATTPFTLNYDCPFFVGLTIVTAGSPNLTVIYE